MLTSRLPLARRSGGPVGRSRSVTRTYIQIQREAEREARARAAAETRAAREAERAERAYQRALAAEAKEQKRLYQEARAAGVDLQNQELQDQVARLQLLLADTLLVDDALNFESLKEQASISDFDPVSSPSQPRRRTQTRSNPSR
jgi:restriction system protein